MVIQILNRVENQVPKNCCPRAKRNVSNSFGGEPIIDRICIAGLGLIGGSFAKALLAANFKVVGIDSSPEALQQVRASQLEIELYDRPCEAIGKCDLLILCTPPGAELRFLESAIAFIDRDTIILDTAGIKSSIMQGARKILLPEHIFIGGHPMAGREKSGWEMSASAIFNKADFIMTPYAENNENYSAGVKKVKSLLHLCKFGRIIEMSPEKHDRIVAHTSQLLHAISAAILNTEDDFDSDMFCGGSYRDFTRIGDFNAELWTELFILNKKQLGTEIHALCAKLMEMDQALEAEDWNKMKSLFEAATMRRRFVWDKLLAKPEAISTGSDC